MQPVLLSLFHFLLSYMQRYQSLDALRGFAILTMVLSGSIAFNGVLPAWMYHAQVPPPLHQFIPTIPGITWVDLVFPFFLFSMGAAIPLSLTALEKEGASSYKVCWIALRRFLLLTFFALFTYHMRAWVTSDSPTNNDYLFSIAAFVLLWFQFYDYKGMKYRRFFLITKMLAFASAVALLYYLPFNTGQGFLLSKVDIIILVLGNMAFFGTIIWWFTRKNMLLRIGLLAFIMAIFLGATAEGSLNEVLFNYSPVPWMYTFYYLKYLFIIIPGTVAGEWLKEAGTAKEPVVSKSTLLSISFLSFGLITINVALLFSRYLILNVVLTILICLAIYYLLEKYAGKSDLLRKFWRAAFFLLLLGLFFEAYEGGIKKDPSTYSYYFVSAALAFFMLIGLYGLQPTRIGNAIMTYLSLNGRNPMVAYVAGSLLLMPLMHLTGVITIFSHMNTNAWVGFLRGVLFTGVVSLITIFFTHRKWFWKT